MADRRNVLPFRRPPTEGEVERDLIVEDLKVARGMTEEALANAQELGDEPILQACRDAHDAVAVAYELAGGTE